MPTGKECQDDLADIVFLLDESGSVGSSDFRKALKFVKNVVEKLEIGPNDVQIGVLTFETKVHSHFHFNTFSTKQVNVWLHYHNITG